MRRLSEKIGVVLATYNGERFLQEQLDSLVAQTVLPNRLVVCDDRSTDSTIAILKTFRNSAPFPVEIHINSKTLLPTENFFRAASLCPTDYVALCDQDDLWDERKIELCDRMATASNPDLIVHSVVDFVTDADGKMVATDPRLVKDGVVAGTAPNPSLIWLGMAMVPHKRIFDDIPMRQALWRPHFDRLRAIGAESNQSHWWECHDLYLLYRLRESGRIGLIGDVLAHHRTFAGGWHSDPTPGSLGPAAQGEPVVSVTGAKAYRDLAEFCREMALFYEELGSRAAAKSYYERWSRLWFNRAAIHDRDSSLPAKLVGIAGIAKSLGYRGKWAGGFGLTSLARDLANVAGLRV